MRGFLVYSLWNFLNKIISFFRIQLQIYLLGDSIYSDMLFLSLKNVALFRRIFIDGSFEGLFISHYKNHSKPGAFAFSTFIKIGGCLGILSLILSQLSGFFGNYIYHLSDEKLLIFTYFNKYLSSLIFLLFGMSFSTALLNANKNFHLSAPAPTVGNLLSIASMLYFGLYLHDIVIANNCGQIIYAGGQFLFLTFFMRKYFKYDIISIDSKFLFNIIKSSSINILYPISEMVVLKLAVTLGRGAISYIEYGHKIIQFVFSIIGVSLSSVSAPTMSEKLIKSKQEFTQYSSDIFILTHILLMPIYLILIFMSQEALFYIFHNIKNIKNPLEMSKTVSIIAVSLYFFVQTRILNTIIIAYKQPNRVFLGGGIYSLATIILSFFFISFGYIGLAWAGNTAVILQFLFLFICCLKEKLISINFTNISLFISSPVIALLFLKILSKSLFICHHLNEYLKSYQYLSKITGPIAFCIVFLLLYAIYIGIYWPKTKIFIQKIDKH